MVVGPATPLAKVIAVVDPKLVAVAAELGQLPPTVPRVPPVRVT